MKRLFVTMLMMLAAPVVANAADYQLANGAVHFAAPDAWTAIMQKTDGDPQFVALQLPGAADNTLARITVSAQRVGDAAAYRQFVDAADAKAHKLPGYKPGAGVAGTEVRYGATENKQNTEYREFYTFRNGLALQVRCVRPASASAAWMSTFDAGCTAIAKAISQ